MGMLDGMLDGLATNPAVVQAMGKFEEVRDGIIKAVVHFNTRFDQQDKFSLDTFNALKDSIDSLHSKADRIIFCLEYPESIVPAGAHNILDVVGEQEVKDCKVEGCNNPAIHDHGQGPVSKYFLSR